MQNAPPHKAKSALKARGCTVDWEKVKLEVADGVCEWGTSAGAVANAEDAFCGRNRGESHGYAVTEAASAAQAERKHRSRDTAASVNSDPPKQMTLATEFKDEVLTAAFVNLSPLHGSVWPRDSPAVTLGA